MTTTHDRYTADLEKFKQDTADHVMTIIRDDGVYRHIRFAKPGTGFYRYDLVTWPGYLAITGDIQSWVFSRLTDMFEFFAADRGINPGYWAEKIVASKSPAEELSVAKVRDQCRSEIDRMFDLQTSRNAAMADVELFVLSDADDGGSWPTVYAELCRLPLPDGESFEDVWEWDVLDYSPHYLWACFAINHGIETYRKQRAA